MHTTIQKVKRLILCSLFSVVTSLVFAQEQPKEIKGTVVDAETGLPMPGAQVSVEGFSTAITKDNGGFSVKVPNNSITLVASIRGYQSKLVAVKGRDSMVIQLYPEGYASVYSAAYLPSGDKVPSSQVSSTVSSLDTRDTWKLPSESPENFMQGKVKGLTMTMRSGVPGIGSNMYLRGFNSLNVSNQPTIILDGVLYDNNSYGTSLINNNVINPLSYIDSRDIENITVVKDATSMYGAKASNGVILIRTKRAEDLSTRIDFVAYNGLNTRPSEIPVMGSYDYRQYLNQVLSSSGYTANQIQSMAFMNDDITSTDYYRYHNNTDWQDKIFTNSYSSSYYMRITGGDQIAKYFLSIGTMKNNGDVINTSFQRYTVRFNSDIFLSQKILVSPSIMFSYENNNLMDDGYATSSNPVYMSLVKAPFLTTNVMEGSSTSYKYEGEDILNEGNPYAIAQKFRGLEKNYRFAGSVNIAWKISNNISFNSVTGLGFDKVRESLFVPHLGTAADSTATAVILNRLGHRVQRLFSVYTDNKLVFAKTFDHVHNVNISLGMRYNTNQSTDNYGLGYNSETSDNYHQVNSGTTSLRQSGGELGEWNSISYTASADYNYLKKYLFSVNTAIDGSSRFGKEAKGGVKLFNHKFGVFPSASAAWIVSSEDFMKSADWLELLKLRASYGLNGNDNVGNYLSQQYYVPVSFLGQYGLMRGNLPNPELTWETTRKANGGLDLSFLHERLSLSLDYFYNTTENMLAYTPLSVETGFETALINDGTMRNTGYEIGVNGRILNGKLKWDAGFTISKYKNKVVSLSKDETVTDYNGASILTKVGSPVGLFYGYKTNGVYASSVEAANSGMSIKLDNGTLVAVGAGDMRFVDVNGDKIIDSNDKQVIGNPNPDFTGMFTNKFSWKRVTLEADVLFSHGGKVFNFLRSKLEAESSVDNQSQAIVNRWQYEGQVTDIPKVSYKDPMGNARFSDRWIEDGSYIRLKTLSLSYDVPFTAGFFKYATVYATANNLVTITKYLGFDPEFSMNESAIYQGIDLGLTPQFRSVFFGIRLGL
jgi:TonB-linked SusC/RagA family outer membrane protein